MRRGGFTLIELLIVMAIIAVLAGAMLPIFRTSTQNANVAKASAEVDAIKTASVMLHHDTGAWPPVGTAGAGLISASGIADWQGPYLDDWHLDPWDQDYQIYDTGDSRRVRSRGRDRAVGGTGFDADIVVLITPDTSI